MYPGIEEEYYVTPLGKHFVVFPNPHYASNEGLLAYGGDLSSKRLLLAYQNGIFPWYTEGDPILWWSPNPRLLLYPEKFKLRKSFRRVLRSGKFSVTFDQNFREIIKRCATIIRDGQEATWILPEMMNAYIRLHDEGYAHSIEVHLEGKLVGGLYGVAYGKAFFGESMFSEVSDASKVAFKALSDVLGSRGYDFIDCQMKTDHLISLGAEVVERDLFLETLEIAMDNPSDIGAWHDWHWSYNELEHQTSAVDSCDMSHSI